MVGAMEYHADEPGLNLWSFTLWSFTFSFIFLKNTLKFCSVGQIACVTTHPVTDE